jgi:hypothetical protein
MVRSVRYFDLSSVDDPIPTLGRVVERDNGLYGEVLHEGRWENYPAVIDSLFGSYGDPLTADEAERLAAPLGGLPE